MKSEDDTESIGKRLARAAPWIPGLNPIGPLARLTLIGALAYACWYVANLSYLTLGLIAAFLLWRYQRRIDFGTIHGSSRWETETALGREGMLGHRDGLILGRFKDDAHYSYREALWRLLTGSVSASDRIVRYIITAVTRGRIDLYRGEPGPLICAPYRSYVHCLICASPGAGKAVGYAVPQLLSDRRSMIVLDVKPELEELTSEHRAAMDQRIVRLDMFGAGRYPSDTLNPLEVFDPASLSLIEDLRTMAEALVMRSAKDGDPHWADSAVGLIHAVLLWVVCAAPEELRNLSCVKAILSDMKQITTCLNDMMTMAGTSSRGDILASIAAGLRGIPEKEFGSIFSTANRHTAFLLSELAIPHLATTSFDIRSVATMPTTVYLMIPSHYLETHANLIRLYINTFLLVIKQAGPSEEHEIVFLLDEVAALGEMRELERSLTLLRSYGVRMIFLVQSIAQLETAYPGSRYKVLLDSFSIQIYFGIAGLETATHISKMIGKKTEVAPSIQRGRNFSVGGGSKGSTRGNNQGMSHSSFERDLIKPEEILTADGCVFILRQGHVPILASRITYYTDPEFVDDVPGFSGHRASLASCLLCVLGLMLGLYFLKTSIDVPALFRWSAAAVSPIGGPTPSPDPSPEAERRSHEAMNAVPKDVARGGQPRGRSPRPVASTITLTCPCCANRAEVPSSYAGERVRCQSCQTLLEIPSPEPEDQP